MRTLVDDLPKNSIKIHVNYKGVFCLDTTKQVLCKLKKHGQHNNYQVLDAQDKIKYDVFSVDEPIDEVEFKYKIVGEKTYMANTVSNKGYAARHALYQNFCINKLIVKNDDETYTLAREESCECVLKKGQQLCAVLPNTPLQIYTHMLYSCTDLDIFFLAAVYGLSAILHDHLVDTFL